jgi:hypothetical protein
MPVTKTAVRLERLRDFSSKQVFLRPKGSSLKQVEIIRMATPMRPFVLEQLVFRFAQKGSHNYFKPRGGAAW